MKTYYIDIDKTICRTPKGDDPDYTKCTPIKSRIKIFNKLYDKGNQICYWTSRGMLTGKEWLPLIMKQFTEWGVKYHSITMNKPLFDEYIGDKCTNIKDFVMKSKQSEGGYFFCPVDNDTKKLINHLHKKKKGGNS